MNNRFEWIERYLINDLSVQEQLLFEDLLRNDPELMKEFLLRKDIKDALLEEDVINLRNTLNEVMEGSFSRKIKLIYTYSALSAFIVLFIVIACIYILPAKKVDVFNSYYSPYPSMMSFRSIEKLAEDKQLINEGVEYYDREKYDKASEIFERILKEDRENYMIQFYLSICEIEKDNLSVAEKYLIDLTQKEDNFFWEQSNWYLALVYIKKNQLHKGEALLRKIIREDMSYKSSAEHILKVLN